MAEAFVFQVVIRLLRHENGYGIYAQQYNATGEPVGDEYLINSFVAGNQITVAVAALDNGAFVVTWYSAGHDGNRGGIFGQQFAPQIFGTSAGETMTDTNYVNWLGGNPTMISFTA